ncbi:helix-turn-helix domain-containing protein [Sphingomonas sp. Leaf208]|uniref:helix-turn-helix domain-containing protein n=1 Tax=Sphingomonas sp. Leaf208 TaxID=1735679 RepID=UPI0009EBD501
MLLIMARLGNRSLRCYASEQTLADRCGFSVSTASRAIDHLKERSYIKQIICTPRTRRTNTYQLCINLWITRAPVRPNRTLMPSGWTVEAGQVDRQNLGSESGSKRHAARPPEGMSIGDCVAPLIAEAKARSR